jgi:hypothetical protein
LSARSVRIWWPALRFAEKRERFSNERYGAFRRAAGAPGLSQ